MQGTSETTTTIEYDELYYDHARDAIVRPEPDVEVDGDVEGVRLWIWGTAESDTETYDSLVAAIDEGDLVRIGDDIDVRVALEAAETDVDGEIERYLEIVDRLEDVEHVLAEVEIEGPDAPILRVLATSSFGAPTSTGQMLIEEFDAEDFVGIAPTRTVDGLSAVHYQVKVGGRQ